MCLLTYLPPGVHPDPTALATGAQNNPDGHGFAIVTGRRLLVRKGLSADTVLADFHQARRAHPDGPAVFHSRIRTHGRLTRANCHPFAVGGDPRTVIAHNGILPHPAHPAPGDHRSDTRIAAQDFLPRFGALHDPATRRKLEQWMGPYNLMVLLTVDPRYRHNAYLLNEASGSWDDGIWYSNDSYLPPLPVREPSWTRQRTGWSDTPRRLSQVGMLTCAACDAIADPEQEWCPWCGHCWACADPPEHCTCWTPAALTATRPDLRC